MPILYRQLGHASLATANTYLAHIAPKEVIGRGVVTVVPVTFNVERVYPFQV